MSRATRALAARSLRGVTRRPQFFAPILIFPSLLLAVNVGGLGQTTKLPGFPPVASFLDFQLAAAISQSLLLGAVGAGIAVALEIEGGFFDRLVTAPIPRVSIVLGRLVATFFLAMAQASFFLAVGVIFGATIVAGVPGVLIVLLISGIAGMGFGGLGMTLALRARSASVVQGVFPLAFVVLFLSTAFFPEDLLGEPAKTIAKYNPLSYVADGIRDPIISSISAAPVLEGLAAAIGLAVVFALLAVHALRGRLREA